MAHLDETVKRATLSQSVFSLLAALMCGWLGIVAYVCVCVLLKPDVFLIFCQSIVLIPITGYFSARLGWRNSYCGRPPGRPDPPLSHSRIRAVALIFACVVSPSAPSWFSGVLSGVPSRESSRASLQRDRVAYERVASVISQHPELECVDRMHAGNIEPFPAMDGSPLHRDEIRKFMREHPEVQRIDCSFQTRAIHFQLWNGTKDWFSSSVRGLAYSSESPSGVVDTLDSSSRATHQMNPRYEPVTGRWYLFEAVFD